MNLDRKNQSAPRPNKSEPLNCETLVIWSFVVYCFAAFFYVMYQIWVKCQDH